MDLQCRVNFCCQHNDPVIRIHIRIYILFLVLSSIMFYPMRPFLSSYSLSTLHLAVLVSFVLPSLNLFTSLSPLLSYKLLLGGIHILFGSESEYLPDMEVGDSVSGFSVCQKMYYHR